MLKKFERTYQCVYLHEIFSFTSNNNRSAIEIRAKKSSPNNDTYQMT